MQNSPVCVDASFLVRLLTSNSANAPAPRLWATWHEAGLPVVAPTLVYYEVTNALRRYVVHGELLPQEAADCCMWRSGWT